MSVTPEPVGGREWCEPGHVARYRARFGAFPHWEESEDAFVEHLPEDVSRFLDLGTGDGRLIALVRGAIPTASALGLDFSPEMLRHAAARFGERSDVRFRAHDLADPLPDMGDFDLIVSGFAIHHLRDPRKRELYGEVGERLRPGGQFLNLEHVASGSPRLHRAFMATIDGDDEDPSNQLVSVCDQLEWLRELGFEDVDCHWKWRELALIGGRRPGPR